MSFAYRLRHVLKRWKKFFIFWLALSLAPLLGVFLGESSPHLQSISLRIAVQSAILFTLGSWWLPHEVIHFFRRFQIPPLILDLINSMMHFGLLLAVETKRKFESLRLRFAGYRFINSPQTVGAVLASSMELSFERLLRVEDVRELRGTNRAFQTSLSHSSSTALQTQTIDIRNLCIEIDGIEVIHDFSLTAKAGEWIGIVGASGCGKTTLLKCIAGLVPPLHGHVEVCGRNLETLPLKARVSKSVQMLFQDPWDQILGITPFEDLMFNFKESNLSCGEIEKEIYAICGKVGLGPKIHRSVSTLSFGERKRLCIAQMLLADPQIILCDEPTSGLDQKNIELITHQLVEKFGHRTVLWVSHDLENLPHRLDRVIQFS